MLRRLLLAYGVNESESQDMIANGRNDHILAAISRHPPPKP